MATIFNIIRSGRNIIKAPNKNIIRTLKTISYPNRYFSINNVKDRVELLSKGYHNTIFDKIKNGFIYNSFVSINIDNDILKTQLVKYKYEINNLRDIYDESPEKYDELKNIILDLEIEYRKYNVLINTINRYHSSTLKMMKCNDFQNNLLNVSEGILDYYEIECINYIDTMYKTQYIQEFLFNLFPELCCYSKYNKDTDERVLCITKHETISKQILSLNSLNHN